MLQAELLSLAMTENGFLTNDGFSNSKGFYIPSPRVPVPFLQLDQSKFLCSLRPSNYYWVTGT